MAHTVRCKFRCNAKIEHPDTGDGPFWNIRMTAVYEGDSAVQAASENAIFGKYTPSGDLTLTLRNQGAAAQFEQGEEYYLDIHKADGWNREQIEAAAAKVADFERQAVEREAMIPGIREKAGPNVESEVRWAERTAKEFRDSAAFWQRCVTAKRYVNG